MSLEQTCNPTDFNDYFAQNSDKTDLLVGPNDGLYRHAFRYDAIMDSDDMELLEAVIDADTLQMTVENPSIERFFGRLGLHGVSVTPVEPYADIVVCYPTIERLQESILDLKKKVSFFKPPEIQPYPGGIYSAQEFVAALCDDKLLVSEQDFLEHDVVQHVSAWLSLPPYIFKAIQNYAEHTLRFPGDPDAYGSLAANRFVDRLDITIGLSPCIGRLLACRGDVPEYETSHGLLLRDILGSQKAGRKAFDDISDYANAIGNELA